MSEHDRRMRAAERRSRAVLRRSSDGVLSQEGGDVVREEAMSLAARLTEECWSLGGMPWPQYSRGETPYRFVPIHT